ncbi:selenoprotein K [Crotalus adamanteus]|uniref:Selenoprotein K n=1 Tax=Crotalus adamanteus TaxID=8729 RepID=A0AAW1BWU2_CROAD
MSYISNRAEQERTLGGRFGDCRVLSGRRRGGVAMVYISNGQVLDNQSRAPWSLSSITDFFWGIADFIVMFFQSIIHPDLRRGYTSSSSSRYDDGRGPPGFPRLPHQWLGADEEGKCLR